MEISGNYCRRIKSWVNALLTNNSVDAKFKSVDISTGEAYKQATEIILRIKALNTFVGIDAGKVTTGDKNNFIGHGAGRSNTTGIDNNFMGYRAGHLNTTGHNNNFMGYAAGYAKTTGCYNTCVGTSSGQNNATGHKNVFIGNSAGFYETGGYKLFIDNAARADEADGRVKALIYGVFDAATANQLLRINAKKVEMPQLGDYANDAAAATGGIAIGGLYHTTGAVKVRVA